MEVGLVSGFFYFGNQIVEHMVLMVEVGLGNVEGSLENVEVPLIMVEDMY